MNTILKHISESLDAKELNYNMEEESDAIYFSMGGCVADVQTIIRIQADNIIAITAVLSVNIPEKSYPRVMDAMNEINKNALISTLYLDKNEKRAVSQSFVMITDESSFDDEIFTTYLSSAITRINSNAEDLMKAAYCGDDETFSQIMLRKQIEEAIGDEKMC